MKKKSIVQYIFVGLFFFFLAPGVGWTQTTSFIYQGKLTDIETPQASYQMRFELYDALAGGGQIGASITNNSVAVTEGVFSVTLDFGAEAFYGADRFLEIAVKRNASASFTILSPRQQIRSIPYAARALNAGRADLALDSNRLGGIDAAAYVTTAGAGNAFVNNATTQQAGNFNISGNGIVGDTLAVGTTPNLGFKFDVSGNTRMTTANGAVITFASPNSESGMSTIFNGGRADLRFDGLAVKLIAGPAGGPPSSASGITINTAGNIGVGTVNPLGKLHVAGNTVQDRDKGGMVKAMLYVDGIQFNPAIIRCYNGVTGASSGNCGFTVSQNSEGIYDIGFGFQVSDRFITVTAQSGPPLIIGAGTTNYGTNFNFNSQNNTSLTVTTFYSANSEGRKSGRFMILVY